MHAGDLFFDLVPDLAVDEAISPASEDVFCAVRYRTSGDRYLRDSQSMTAR